MRSSGALSRQPERTSGRSRLAAAKSTARDALCARRLSMVDLVLRLVPDSRPDGAIEREPDRLLEVVVRNDAVLAGLPSEHRGALHFRSKREIAADVELRAAADRQRVLRHCV